MTPLIPRIGSDKVGSISLAYPIQLGLDFGGICDTGSGKHGEYTEEMKKTIAETN